MMMILRSISLGTAAYTRCGCRQHHPKGHIQLFFAHFSSSASSDPDPNTNEEDQPPPNAATVIQGPSLLTSTGVNRPSPSLFHLPGLRSLPFWTSPGPSQHGGNNQQHGRQHRIAFNDPIITSAVQHVESNYDDIRAEYFSSVLGQGNETNPHDDSVSKPLEPDYDVSSKGGEHAEDSLHSGTWDWHSYILNGVKNERFKERCPKTAQVIDDVSKL